MTWLEMLRAVDAIRQDGRAKRTCGADDSVETDPPAHIPRHFRRQDSSAGQSRNAPVPNHLRHQTPTNARIPFMIRTSPTAM